MDSRHTYLKFVKAINCSSTFVPCQLYENEHSFRILSQDPVKCTTTCRYFVSMINEKEQYGYDSYRGFLQKSNAVLMP